MMPLRTACAIGLLSVGVCACGSAGTSSVRRASSGARAATAATTTSTSANTAPAPVNTTADADKDNDLGAPDDDRSNNEVLGYGHAAVPSERRAIASLVERYYKAALAEDGANACSMLFSTLAEAVPEDYGQSPPGPTYMHGTTCPAAVTALFKHYHRQLAIELPRLRVRSVRVDQRHGLVVLNFGALPERQISVEREGRIWRINTLLDSELP